MTISSLLFQKEIVLNDFIKIRIPTLAELFEIGEEEYYMIVNMLTSMPIDQMVMLDSMGIDFTEISEYELFILHFSVLSGMDASIIFGDLDLTKFVIGVDESGTEPVLIDPEHDYVIDRKLQQQISSTVRMIHGLERNTRKPGNEEAKEYMLERAKIKAQRNARKKQQSNLEAYIIALVNTEQFKYNYSTVLDLTIYQFNASLTQIIRKSEVDHLTLGIYTGNIDPKKLIPDSLDWLSPIKKK